MVYNNMLLNELAQSDNYIRRYSTLSHSCSTKSKLITVYLTLLTMIRRDMIFKGVPPIDSFQVDNKLIVSSF